jgi:predicted nuclease of predicted toxin-antitoxin system
MRILLDSHLPSALARQLQRHEIDAVPLAGWMEGIYRNAADEQILEAAYSDRRVLVTYDVRTVPPLLVEWAETGQHHGGVVLVDDRTLPPNDVGGLLRALLLLIHSGGDEAWEDRVLYLSAKLP